VLDVVLQHADSSLLQHKRIHSQLV
jgi:hypothetical protein